MLLITRKHGEAVVLQIGDKAIRVLVMRDGDGKTTIGIEAPAEVKILREELVPHKAMRATR